MRTEKQRARTDGKAREQLGKRQLKAVLDAMNGR